jgi:leucyl-tRNA synthetase
VQIGGKVRDKLQVAPGTAAAELERAALLLPNVDKYLNGRSPQKVIVVPDKLVNLLP